MSTRIFNIVTAFLYAVLAAMVILLVMAIGADDAEGNEAVGQRLCDVAAERPVPGDALTNSQRRGNDRMVAAWTAPTPGCYRIERIDMVGDKNGGNLREEAQVTYLYVSEAPTFAAYKTRWFSTRTITRLFIDPPSEIDHVHVCVADVASEEFDASLPANWRDDPAGHAAAVEARRRDAQEGRVDGWWAPRSAPSGHVSTVSVPHTRGTHVKLDHLDHHHESDSLPPLSLGFPHAHVLWPGELLHGETEWADCLAHVRPALHP